MDSRYDFVEQLFPSSSPRTYAHMPRRNREHSGGGSNVDALSATSVDSLESPLFSMVAQRYTSSTDLAKAADDLLAHFDQTTTIREDGKVAVARASGRLQGKQNAVGKESGKRLIEDSSGSSSGGEIEIKISGLMTPDDSSSSKNGLWEDGNSIIDTYSTPADWSAVPASTMPTTAPISSEMDYDCEHGGCYALTTRFIDDDRLSDDYAARGGGKKRKVPASAQQGPTQPGEREENACLHSCGHVCGEETITPTKNTMDRQAQSEEEHGDHFISDLDSQYDQQSCPHSRCCDHHSSIRIVPDPVIRVPKRRMTDARMRIGFEKRLFNARKAQVLGLHADAVTCLGQTKQKNAAIPSKEELEELISALEYTGVSGWEGDKVGTGAGLFDGHAVTGRIKGDTLIGTSVTAGSSDLVAPSVTTTSSSDQPSDAAKQDSGLQTPGKLNWWKRGRMAERYEWLNRKAVKRKGWIPEGTFEFEMPSTDATLTSGVIDLWNCSVASTIRDSNQKLNTLRVKVTQLLTLTLSSPSMTSFLNGKPIPNGPSSVPPLPVVAKTEKKMTNTAAASSAAAKPKHKPAGSDLKIGETLQNTRNPLSGEKVQQVNDPSKQEPATSPLPSNLSPLPPAPVATATKTDQTEHKQQPAYAHANSANVVVEPSADDPDYVPSHNAAGGAKKGKKKKKKSAMANAANPHHVKNYVPSRRPVNAPQTEMPNLVDMLATLFFPPPTRFLNSRPRKPDSTGQPSQSNQQKSAPSRPLADPADDEYVCSLCEYDLFFGTEQAMFKAIDRRKKVIERRQKAQEKAKGVMAGKGLRPKSKKGGGGDGGDTEDDERCAGGEQCRCAEIRAGNPEERDSNPRKTDDPASAGTENPGQPLEQFDATAHLEDCSIIDDSSIIDEDTSSEADQSPERTTAVASPLPPSSTHPTLIRPPERTAKPDVLSKEDEETPPVPDVDNFELDHADKDADTTERGATIHTTIEH
ncbi:hypothetical protein QFC22_005065 [Naganishia vaughanmartiniae]|uniref:Uncharacterized protein n=1 Tax=Naganishia vaughanmartiniae TaxID=1424756 RepID=A0ACC2WZH2_9TREE|nr:hypothetical protein QFC22_005065 [Naganishia vaughanmartiniae]